MKAISKLLIAGMLAVGIAVPEHQGVYAAQVCTPFGASACATIQLGVQITDALAYRILAAVTGELEAQLNQSLSTDFLYNAYKNGQAKITYLGYDGIVYSFSVEYMDGLGIAGLVEGA